MNKEWILHDYYIPQVYELRVWLFYKWESLAELYKDKFGDWCCNSKILNWSDEYIDNYNDHESLEVVQMYIEDKIYEHYIDESNYYADLARQFKEE